MPTIAIDTFFACTLMIAVVIVATTLSTETLNARINQNQHVDTESSYLRALSENIVLNTGLPDSWGSDGSIIPETFGLAKNGAQNPMELDVDKICRLNSENAFALSYTDILNAARLKNVALGVSVSQLIDLSIAPYSNSTIGDFTEYTFEVDTSQYDAPIAAYLHCYTVARNFLSDEYNETSASGVSYVNVEIPNSSNGTASLVVFARAKHDQRISGYKVHPFRHLSLEPLPNRTFLDLSPLNNTLWLSSNSSSAVLEDAYAFSYEYESSLALVSNMTYAIPVIQSKSPIILLVTGTDGLTFFIEWTAYPQIPLETGATFSDSECYAFTYVVNIKGALYRLTLRFGGLSQ
jgi:hypothetical protein